MAEELLRGTIKANSDVTVSLKDEKIVFSTNEGSTSVKKANVKTTKTTRKVKSKATVTTKKPAKKTVKKATKKTKKV